MFSKASVLILAVAAQSALAKLYMVAPVASTTWAVGTDVTVQWQDDGSSPSLAEMGVSSLGVYAGNSIQQTLLQQVGTMDVSVNNSITFKINTDIGPNGQSVYFMRFSSESLKDATNTAYPAQSFSAMFAVSGSTGTFNSTVEAQVQGLSSASGSAPAASATTGASSVAAVVAKTSSAASVKATATAQAAAAAGNSTTASGASARFYLPSAGALAVAGALSAFVL
ncbi:hypothetical protein PENSPDRAFT_658074 [Peniophora sp. CONT]|nr:hypothetical protein PENSPDRAFT_658074 [Peniophora sp. CONT]